MDPFRFVADGVVSSAPLRKASRTDHYYGFALSRSRSAPSSARRGIGRIQVPSKRQRHRHWLRRSRAMPFVIRSPFCWAKSTKGGSMSSAISRREILSMAGAAGGLFILGSGRPIQAQSAKRIEQMMPELGTIISTSEPIRELATGFGGDIGPAEGPVWIAEGRYLLFNDINRARRMKYTPGQSATVAMEK